MWRRSGTNIFLFLWVCLFTAFSPPTSLSIQYTCKGHHSQKAGTIQHKWKTSWYTEIAELYGISTYLCWHAWLFRRLASNTSLWIGWRASSKTGKALGNRLLCTLVPIKQAATGSCLARPEKMCAKGCHRLPADVLECKQRSGRLCVHGSTFHRGDWEEA